ncbi:MAG: MarR family winged helix-turn-helix transcriptional regulator [Xanthobacteraceae bacterium]
MAKSTKRGRSSSTGRLRLDLPNFVPYRITTLAALIRRALAGIYSDDPGLNEPEWKVLTALAHFGPLPSGDISHYVTLDRVAVSRALARLIELGFATRGKNPDDGRMFTVDLTARAARLYDRMAAQALEIEEPVLAALEPEEVRELLRLLDKVESCFRSPADRRRMLLMQSMREPDEGNVIRRQRASRGTSKAKRSRVHA